jgi:hypothetical protein
MKNPLTNFHIPTFNEYPEEFSKIYKIKIIDKLETKREFLGVGQQFKNLCLVGGASSVLLNEFNIKFSHEYNIVHLTKSINKLKKKLAGDYYDEKKNDIKQQGAYVRDLKNLADFFDLNLFNSNKPTIEELIQLIDVGIKPIPFIPFNKDDKEGH